MKYLHILFPAIILVVLTVQTKAQSNSDSLSYAEQYQQELARLSSEFEKQGYDLSTFTNDNRFEVYGEIDQRFKGSAERTTPTLDEYKEILDFEEKVSQGVEFLHTHSNQLRKAEEKYGIPKYLITAIIGIESKYGTVLGSYNPLNVYISMALVDYRADFAKAQLKELLEFVDRKQVDVFTLKSSYAGAMSPAQFIPYSVNKWWVGKDIFDMDNSIMSVANYLAHFQERTNSLRTSVLRYNPSDLYADTILDLADEIEKESK
ncbi:lytic murein transglycosylase [Fodinibius salsisoli]|uniref:Lytic murein transglycosylase n=1 Tax=Fodinibius salsisoli TaxID=2820877 RepID=A0ABT3PPN7_9BACT|nr:lytic murein transglycosylase [Fodinibius salsisoli]MCW9707829.1 lytic murein transglycosylase [Fodinibius salsisoli]